jgi:excinuclease ABC subunit A
LTHIARYVEISGYTLPHLCRLPLEEAYSIVNTWKSTLSALEAPLQQILHRLHLLIALGMGYISLQRTTSTLSGGENQRARLAKQISGAITGCLYILDEPTMSLDRYNRDKVHKALGALKNLGNTLLIVENDLHTLQLADHILEFGPHSGKGGGQIVAEGALSHIMQNPHSATRQYLIREHPLSPPSQRRRGKGVIAIEKSAQGREIYNPEDFRRYISKLHDIPFSIPTQTLTCITGISGSGKSTLMRELIYGAAKRAIAEDRDSIEHLGATLSGFSQFERVIYLSQASIGQTARADVATYMGLLTLLRELFVHLPFARATGLNLHNFSYNHKDGMCTTCKGLGKQTLLLQFLAPVEIPCPACGGFRLNPLSLEARFKGKHLGELLQCSVEELSTLFSAHPKVMQIVDRMIEGGLGYLQLEQGISTLSRGEAQRLRLAREFAKHPIGSCLYLLDEPTRGLHFTETHLLIRLFETLITQGHTVIMIEHNLEMIILSDHLIELGPGAGDGGGRIIAQGTPEEVSQMTHSQIAAYTPEEGVGI